MITLTPAMAHVINTSIGDYYEAPDGYRLTYADRMVGAINAVLCIAEAEQGAGQDPEPGRPAAEPGQPAAELKPRHSTKKVQFDLGKAKALRDAGWSNAKIADEMRVSISTVARRLAGDEDEYSDEEA